METNGNEQWEKAVRTNTVMDSKCQEFNIQFYFSGFMSCSFIIYVVGSMCVVKGIAENVYRGKRLRVRIVREIWDEARGVSTSNT